VNAILTFFKKLCRFRQKAYSIGKNCSPKIYRKIA